MNFSTESTMLQTNTQSYTKLRWLLTVGGLVLYVVDIWIDVALALKYFHEKDLVWTALTLLFVLAGVLVTQIFSYAWYRDDMKEAQKNSEGAVSGMSRGALAALHLFGVGMFIRYYYLLKKGFRVLWKRTDSCTEEQKKDEHHHLFCLATDLSMLKLFEAFLESVPQLLLQLYIVLSQSQGSVRQYLSMAFSFFNIAWALVDYRRCLRRSLPHIKEMPSGLPTVIYLLYKLCTITSIILSYALLLLLSPYSAVALTVLWLLGTLWTHLLRTSFCSSVRLELLYRGVIGVILTFTFFNVKGQDTKVVMIIFYLFHGVINIIAPSLLALLRPELRTSALLLTVSGLILGGSVLGLVCLLLYYLLLHPREKSREVDEVDGLGKETESMRRIRDFLQP